MAMARASQGIYSPLPQSISDSDSEKELNMMDPVCPTYGNNNVQNGNFSTNSNNSHNNFKSLRNDIPKTKSVTPKMSTLRKCVFVFSILLCFLPVVLFLWVLPCSDTDFCGEAVSDWESQQENIELKGEINLIHGIYKNSFNLAILYKGGLYFHENLNHGAISFLGRSGAVAWNFKQEIMPKQLDCSLIDVIGNGLTDCLLLDDRGLKVIGTISGEVVWHVHSHEEGKTIGELDFPIKTLDFNRDNINELLMIYRHRSLLLVCGKTGKALKKIELPCSDASNLKNIDNQAIGYVCSNGPEYFKVSLVDLQNKFANESFDLKFVRIKHDPSIEAIESLAVSEKKVVISNERVCPDCTANIALFDNKLNKKLISWSYNNAYVMKPKVFAFQSTEANIASLRGHVNGFILKIWQWPDTGMQHRVKVTDPNDYSTNSNNFTLNYITERVVLVTFNESNAINIFNASLTEIRQLCFPTSVGLNCQPDIHNQEDSLLVCDLDHDGSQELISYSVTYIPKGPQPKDRQSWHLVSNVTVVRLEAELPKLFEMK